MRHLSLSRMSPIGSLILSLSGYSGVRKSVLKRLIQGLIALVLVSLLQASSPPFSHSEQVQGNLKIVATTSLIGSIVKEVGGERVHVVTIVPSGMCPGHFDMKPGDIMHISGARVLLNHGWERWMKKILDSMEEKGTVTRTINIHGNWMVPEIHIQAIDEITEILGEVDPQNSGWYKKNSISYSAAIDSAAMRIQKAVNHLRGKKTVSSKHQKEFLKWLGFDVVATFGRPEELSPRELIKLIRIARREGVQIVVANLQSGPKAGEQIAAEIGAKHVVLTNFPLGESYIESLNENVAKIIQACR